MRSVIFVCTTILSITMFATFAPEGKDMTLSLLSIALWIVLFLLYLLCDYTEFMNRNFPQEKKGE